MNFRQIEIFAAVMRAGTVSKAADVLSITQPAASRALADLEQSLGFSLSIESARDYCRRLKRGCSTALSRPLIVASTR